MGNEEFHGPSLKKLIVKAIIDILKTVIESLLNNIKYEYMNVTDISLIPGMTPLFYSNWDNYLEAANAFVEEYPEFKEYLSN